VLSKESKAAILELEISEEFLAVTTVAFTRKREPNAERETEHASRVADASEDVLIEPADLPSSRDRKFLAKSELPKELATDKVFASFKFSFHLNG